MPAAKSGTEETAVSRFVGQPAHRSEAKVDRSGCQLSGLQMDTVPEYYRLAEGEAGLRAIPANQFVEGVPVAALGIVG